MDGPMAVIEALQSGPECYNIVLLNHKRRCIFMSLFKIKLEDDTLYDFEAEGTLEAAIAKIRATEQFLLCKDYRGKPYYVNKQMIKVIYSETE